MRQIKAWIMIGQIREQKKLSRKALSAGLCSAGTLCRYESGERIPDGLLFHCFMQRLGMNPEDFSVMLSAREYQYYVWKETVFEALQKQDWSEVKRLYCSGLAEDRSCNAKIQNQFYLYLSSVLAEKTEKDNEKMLRFLREAISETVPGCGDYGVDAYRLSVFEVGLLALYYYKGGMRHLIDPEEVHSRLKSLIDYTIRKVADKQEGAKLVPGMVCAMLHICGERMEPVERLSLEETAVKLLKESYRFYHLPELLRLYIKDLRQLDAGKAHVYEMQYQAFVEALGDAGYDTAFQPELLFDSRKQIDLLNEYILSCREAMGMTQVQMSMGICAVETYCRLERGKQMPHLKEGEAILERLKIGWGYFRGDLETTDYQAFEYLHQFKDASRREEWQKAGELIEEIRKRVDMESVNNRQFVGLMENQVAFATGRIDAEVFYQRDKALLELSVKEKNLKRTKFYYFSYVEIILHTHLANVLVIMGKDWEGIELLKRMLEKMEGSQVGFEYWWESIKLSIFNLANMLSDMGEYGESLKYMENFIDLCFRLSDGKFLGYGIGERALDLDKLEKTDKATCGRLLIQVFYLTDFYDLQVNHKMIQGYYEKYYDADKQWYG